MEGKSRILVILAICVFMLWTLNAQADVHYVDSSRPDDNGDGLSWANAEQTVQAAINASASGDEIWVKAGTYNQCITLKSGVGLYGGFAGTETARSQRDWTTNTTTLDGTNGNNAVVTGAGTSTTVIDGFTITGGVGYQIQWGPAGGGIYCNGCSPTISNNTITGNSTCKGGGIYGANCSSLISNNTITGNATTYSGGGIQCDGSPTILGNTITNNETGNYGGGIVVGTGSPVIHKNVISGNEAVTAGGIWSYTCDVTISGNTIQSNNATSAAGVRCYGGSAVICNNLIAENTSTTSAACGIEYNTGSSCSIVNNTISRNTGGTTYGAGILCSDASASISNNIVAFNSSGVYKAGTGTATLLNNCVQGNTNNNYYGISAGTGDISSDPQLADYNNGDYHLTFGSPCIDKGEDDEVTQTWKDIDGGSRQVDIEEVSSSDTVDIGADEFVLIHVDGTNGSNSNDGSTWADAKATVQAGLNAAQTGSEVWVKAGTYTECITLKNNVRLYGGQNKVIQVWYFD